MPSAIYLLALRLASELADLRAANANRYPGCRKRMRSFCITDEDSRYRSNVEPDPAQRWGWRLQRKKDTFRCPCVTGATRNRTGDKGFADLCLTAWLWRRDGFRPGKEHGHASVVSVKSGLRGSNPPPRPWQGRALPNELNPHVPPVGIEPTTRGFSVLCSTN